MRTLVWFRDKDLRVADHAPLAGAIAAGEVIPLYVVPPALPSQARARPHHLQFLLQSIQGLAEGLAARGSRLVITMGAADEVVPALARRWKVDRVAAHQTSLPDGRSEEQRVAAALGPALELHPGETLLPAGSLRNRLAQPYAVFTHFAREHRARSRIGVPLPAPRALPPLPDDVLATLDRLPAATLSPADLGLAPNPLVQPGGERAARQRLRTFLGAPTARQYHELRDRLDQPGTSRLSADLKFGTLSMRAVWRAVTSTFGNSPAGQSFTSELLWREFAYSTLHDRPDLLATPFRPGWAHFPWTEDARALAAWAEGRTGYPIVDAAARQLLGEGFVPNRARMVSASFLTKHLLVDYRAGEAHYLRYLTDGDPAQNNFNWQWCAGCGCDAQPYFRLWNPVLQGEKFDPEGAYVRRWVPELATLPASHIHRPWQAPAAMLAAAGVALGRDYPEPIVDHDFARARFLALAQDLVR